MELKQLQFSISYQFWAIFLHREGCYQITEDIQPCFHCTCSKDRRCMRGFRVSFCLYFLVQSFITYCLLFCKFTLDFIVVVGDNSVLSCTNWKTGTIIGMVLIIMVEKVQIRGEICKTLLVRLTNMLPGRKEDLFIVERSCIALEPSP